MQDILVIFTRSPMPGKVKTRLIPKLDAYGAARLQRDMALHVINTGRGLMQDMDVEIHYDGEDQASIRHLAGGDIPVKHQAEGDLGQRMFNSFCCMFERNYKRMVLIGSDCPLITIQTLRQSFDMLGSYDCVLGPARDGGYYLIGLKQPNKDLFTDIFWGGSRVFAETIARAESNGLAAARLETLPDIDRPEDITIWKELYCRETPSISVIIPILNEAGTIVETLKHLQGGENIEPIVVDGGSKDQGPALASKHGACVIQADPGRANQMNAGAQHAAGEILLFLHADTLLPKGFDHYIRQSLADPRNIAGAFGLRFDKNSFTLNIIETGANLRSRHLQLPYGDQGIFLRRADFQTLGGFPEVPVMEDFAFMQALKKQGTIVTLPQKIITSARRFEVLGVINTWLINQCVIMSYLKGADPVKIAGLYRSQKGITRWLGFLCGIFRDKRNKRKVKQIPM